MKNTHTHTHTHTHTEDTISISWKALGCSFFRFMRLKTLLVTIILFSYEKNLNTRVPKNVNKMLMEQCCNSLLANK